MLVDIGVYVEQFSFALNPILSLELPNLFEPQENQSSYKCCCFPFLQREVRIGSPPKQNTVSSHETINPTIKKPIHLVEILLSTSALVPQSVCVHALLLPTIKENKEPSTRHTENHYTLKGWTGHFRYWQMKTEQRMAPPRQSSPMNRNLWFLHALARAFTAPSFLSQNSPSSSAPVKQVAPTTGDCSSHFVDFID